MVKFLPAYALPAGLPSMTDMTQPEAMDIILETPSVISKEDSGTPVDAANKVTSRRPTSPSRPAPLSFRSPEQNTNLSPDILTPRSYKSVGPVKEHERVVLQKQDESFLLPAHMPPKYGLFDLFPFSLLVSFLSERGKEVKGKKGARVRAKIKQHAVSHNLPLELSLYLVRYLSTSLNENKLNLTILKSSYIASLQSRKLLDVPTASTSSFFCLSSTVGDFSFFKDVLVGYLNQLVESLTGLERILTTPIPFSFVQGIIYCREFTKYCCRYSIHLWVVTHLFCLFLVCGLRLYTAHEVTFSLFSPFKSGKLSIGLLFLPQFL